MAGKVMTGLADMKGEEGFRGLFPWGTQPTASTGSYPRRLRQSYIDTQFNKLLRSLDLRLLRFIFWIVDFCVR